MSHCIRLIPRLDIKGPNVVKPVHTEALRVVGDPRELAQRYAEEGADELFYADIVASLYRRKVDLDQLTRVMNGIFIPVTVAGGIRSLQDIHDILRAGADKIAINTYAIERPAFLAEAVQTFGAQCIMLFVEAKQRADGRYEAFTDGGREPTGRDVVPWIQEAIGYGVGEVLITSIDQEGTRRGYDAALIQKVAAVTPVPLIVHGGAGAPQTLVQAVREGGADALAMSSVLHYRDYSIHDAKQAMEAAHLPVRL